MAGAVHGSQAAPEPLLSAQLALPDGELTVAAGELVALPDDPRHVHALLGVGSTSFGPAASGRHRVRLAGRRLDRRSRAARVRAGLVGVGSGAVAPDVTVAEHLAAVHGRADANRRLAEAPLLAGRGGDPAGVLSGGERRVLDWLVADALRPRAAVLDRPGTGLDPDALAWAHRMLDRWLDAGAAVVLRVGRDDEARWLYVRADGTPRSDGRDAPPDVPPGATPDVPPGAPRGAGRRRADDATDGPDRG